MCHVFLTCLLEPRDWAQGEESLLVFVEGGVV